MYALRNSIRQGGVANPARSGPLRLNRRHPVVANGKLKFLAPFTEGHGVPIDLVSGAAAAAVDATPPWIRDPREGFAADLSGATGFWEWTGVTHGILAGSYSMLARFNLTATVSWGGILCIDRGSVEATYYHHTSNNMGWDTTVNSSYTGTQLPWVNGHWRTGLMNIEADDDLLSFYRDGVLGDNISHASGGSFATNAPISIGKGQTGDNTARGYVSFAAMFSPELTHEESRYVSRFPEHLVEMDVVLPRLIFVSTAAGPFTGTIAQIAPAVTQALTGAQTISGTISQITAPATQSATGTSLVNLTGTIAQTIAAVTQSLTGTSLVNLTGTIAQVISPVTQALTAAQTLTGTIAQTIASATQSLTGIQTISGVISQTVAATQQALTGAQTISGSIAQTIASVTQSISGTTTAIFTGSIAQTIGRVVQSLTATSGWPGVVKIAKHAHRAIVRSK